LTKSIIFAIISYVLTKNKNTVSSTEKMRNLSAQLGIILMSAAATIGMLEMPDHSKAQILVPARAVFAYANENSNDPANSIRRERDEEAPHYLSYSETQRTPSRSGKR
jgi:hypothetical protein